MVLNNYTHILYVSQITWNGKPRVSKRENIIKEKIYKREKQSPTVTPCEIGFDFTWILRRYVKDQNFDEFPPHSHVLFWFNFGDPKIHAISTYFFRCNFYVPKIHVVSTYFFGIISMVEKSTLFPHTFFDGRKNHVVFTCFFWCNFDGRTFDGEVGCHTPSRSCSSEQQSFHEDC